MKLTNYDLSFALRRLPRELKELMKNIEWGNLIFVGGGYLRSIVSGEAINDVDVFCADALRAELLANKLALIYGCKIIKTENAYTVLSKPLTIQIIHRWVFNKAEDVADSFDFTICCAAFSYNNGIWFSYCDDNFYADLAAKRLVYRSPKRNEDAGGSILRVLKYYQKGYRIPLDSLGAVIARFISVLAINGTRNEEHEAKVLTGLLRVVDPNVDPDHEAHLPAKEAVNKEITEETPTV